MPDHPTDPDATSIIEPDATAAAPGPAAPQAVSGRRVRRRLRRVGVAVGALVVFGAVFVAGAGLERGGLLPGREIEAEPQAAADFVLVREAWDLLHTEFVGARELDSRALAYAAIEALTEATGDTGHTRFMTPSEREAARENLSGSFVGIGVQVDTDEGAVRVVDVFKDSPAQRAGLRRGDRILAVDGANTADTPLDDVVDRVRGPEGTDVRLSIERVGEAEPLDVVVTRAKIDRPAVSWSMVPGTTLALIRLDQFQSGSADEVKAALTEAQAVGATGAVLDLRGNPGGYVDEAKAIASQFLDSGLVYQTRDARGTIGPNEVVEGGVALDLPIVVLVDGATASSSEITAGALQDAGRATVVGVQTFGTGTVLGEFALSDGSALRIGTVEWLTREGRRIWHAGITPDVVVELPAEVFPVSPTDLADLTPKQLADSGDVQLLKALELLEAAASR